MAMTFITFENLKQYHQCLMESLSRVRLQPINQCPNCGAIIGADMKCEYCGTKFKLVKDMGKEE